MFKKIKLSFFSFLIVLVAVFSPNLNHNESSLGEKNLAQTVHDISKNERWQMSGAMIIWEQHNMWLYINCIDNDTMNWFTANFIYYYEVEMDVANTQTMCIEINDITEGPPYWLDTLTVKPDDTGYGEGEVSIKYLYPGRNTWEVKFFDKDNPNAVYSLAEIDFALYDMSEYVSIDADVRVEWVDTSQVGFSYSYFLEIYYPEEPFGSYDDSYYDPKIELFDSYNNLLFSDYHSNCKGSFEAVVPNNRALTVRISANTTDAPPYYQLPYVYVSLPPINITPPAIEEFALRSIYREGDRVAFSYWVETNFDVTKAWISIKDSANNVLTNYPTNANGGWAEIQLPSATEEYSGWTLTVTCEFDHTVYKTINIPKF